MKISASLVLIFCFVTIAAAQERIIDKTEFDAAVTAGNNYYLRLKEQRYRMTVSTSAKIIGRPQNDWFSKMMVERVPNEESRTVTSSTFGVKANPTKEAIVIGNWIYTRSGNDPWSRRVRERTQPQVQPEAQAPESSVEVVGSEAEYKYLGKESLAGKSTDVYQKTERRTQVDKKTGQTSEADVKAKYWFSADGLMVKNEYGSETRGATLTTQTLIIMEWAIDPSIAITEPVMTPAKP